ncbi:Putative metal chaperone YciC [Amycolatopsis sp. CA-230715]|nr:GTP-binding protein [Amycolatopsis sp. CA-230715]QWF83672.1 Putative metal chaperone YciC [Amycolatopsis sp. CA-230715]
MGRDRIPVVILTGFLGSGKTTLLNHLLTRGDARVGVIVNDFGSIGVDAMSVAGQVDSMVSFGNGCLCCAVDARGLDAMLGKLSAPSAGIDVIVIEASGVAEPRDLLRLMIASENEEIAYGGLVQVVDGAEFDRTRTAHPELDQHVALTDLVVLNKTDRITDAERERLLGTIEELSPGKPVVPTSHGRIDPALFFDAERERPDDGQLSFTDLLAEEHDHADHLHTAYDTVSFTSEQPLNPRRLIEFLERRPAGLYRMKGFVDFGASGEHDRFGLHTVGGFLRFDRGRWPSGRRTELVLIGAGIDTGALLAELAACREDDPEHVDERGMLLVLRHVEEPEPVS